VASPAEEGLRYKSVNSCITFLGALHGKQLITVEDLAVGNELHPVQQAMVDHHGSQCGFCTPGFIMSMFALYKDMPPEADRDHRRRITHEYLAGNLCRCTGYRPIVEAALTSTEQPRSDHFSIDEKEMATKLIEISDHDSLDKVTGVETFLIPQSLSELASICLEKPSARLLGGGSDLALEVTQQLRSLDSIILLDQVKELRQVKRDGNRLEIGAAVSLFDCDKLLQVRYPQISELLHRFGSTQVRNQGTIGGNIANASPIGDLPPVLIALDARLKLQRGEQTRVVLVEEFFVDYRKTILQPGEFISAILLPLPFEGQMFRVYKVSKRLDDDISAVCIAINLSLDRDSKDKIRVNSARIALGGMAAIPKRATGCEAILQSAELDTSTIDQAAHALDEDFSPISDARASAGYRIQVAQNLLRRFYFEVCDNSIETRVEHVA